MPKKKTKPTILKDTREQRGWDWEADEDFAGVRHQGLKTGDYSLEGLEEIVTIERKGSADELYANFTQDKKRLFAEFERMREYEYKFIIVEESLEDILNPHNYYVNKSKKNKRSPKMPPAVVMKHLLEATLEYGIHVIYCGDRGQQTAKKILLSVYERYCKGLVNCSPSK